MFKFVSLVLGALLLMACHKSTPPQKSHPLAVDTTIVDTIAEDNWQFTVYGEGWAPVNGPDEATIQVILQNQQLDMLLFFMKDPTQQSLPDYALGAASSFQQAGAQLKEVRSAQINGSQATVITLRTGKSIIWLWVLVKDSVAYDFSCVVKEDPDAGSSQFDFCQSMAHSIQVK